MLMTDFTFCGAFRIIKGAQYVLMHIGAEVQDKTHNFMMSNSFQHTPYKQVDNSIYIFFSVQANFMIIILHFNLNS